jgi:hypothetical protein
LFAATEKAVWLSADEGEHWESLQLNLPHTSMRDLAIHDQDLIVATHGRAFWILDDITPLRALAGEASLREVTLLKPAPAIRAQRSTGTDTPIPPDEPTGRNPPDGAVIDYYLPQAAKGTVTLEVQDAGGQSVRRFSSADVLGPGPAERARELIPAYWIRPAKPLATGVGLHRFIWDLHHAAPRAAKRGYPISAVPGDTPQEPEGPLAVPGEYRVRLSIGTRHWEQPLTVLADPRVKIGAQDFAAQYALAHRLAAALDASSDKVLMAKSMRTQLKALTAQGAAASLSKALDEKLERLLEPPAAGSGTPPRGLTRVNTDVAALYGQVTAADAAPTQSQSSAAARVIAEWQSLDAASAGIWRYDLPALNRALQKARLPPLRSEAVTEQGGLTVDED